MTQYEHNSPGTSLILSGCGVSPTRTLVPVERLWNMACQAVEHRDFNRALFVCRQILEAVPDHFRAKGLLTQLEGAYGQAEWMYRDIERRFDTSGLNELMFMANEADDIYPDHPLRPLVVPRLEYRHRQYKDNLAMGIDAHDRGDIALAAVWYQQALQLNPHEPLVRELVKNADEWVRLRNARC